MRDLVDRMLEMIDRGSWSAERDDLRFGVTIAHVRIDFEPMTPTIGLAFERLATAIEATIAAERARRMINIAGATSQPPPLWLVSGSDILAQWLVWASATNALRKVLVLTDQVRLAPVSGDFDRRARRELGQGGAKIRVRGGMATAEPSCPTGRVAQRYSVRTPASVS